jgi:hypothetical protein
LAFLRKVLFSEERDGKDNCENDAQGAYHDVAPCQERVFASEDVRGGEHEALLAVEGVYWVIIVNSKLVVTWLHVDIDSAPKFSELGKSGGSHPHDEVLVGDINPLVVCVVVSICVSVEVLELVLHVGLPRDVGLIDAHWLVFGAVSLAT